MLPHFRWCVLWLCYSFFSASLPAQSPYLPADSSALFARLDAIAAASIARLPAGFEAGAAEIYLDRSEDLKEGIRDSSFLFDPTFQSLVEGIVNDLIATNDLTLSPLVLISRSPAVNASSLGDGLFVVNLGLLHRIKSSDELAFVIGHELGHDQLGHLVDKLDYLVQQRTGEATDRRSRREMRRRLRQEGREKIMLGLRDLAYEHSRHSRHNELTADSVGASYLLSSSYSVAAATNALTRLRDDVGPTLEAGVTARLLTTQAYPFKEKWIATAPTLFGGSFGTPQDEQGASFWQQDSLASHPDLEERIAVSVKWGGSVSPAVTEFTPHPLVEPSRQLMVRAYLDAGLGAHALQLSLIALSQGAVDEAFYRAAVGEALLETYRSIETHTFDRRTPPTTYWADAGGAELLRFLHQIRNSELQKLILSYLYEQSVHLPDNEYLTAVAGKATHYFNTLDK